MNEVKRWEPRNTVVGYDMQPLKDGSFVLFEDFCRVVDERDAALALSVENIMIDIVPGYDGMGEEVYAKSVADIEDLLTNLCDTGELYEDRVAVLESLLYKYYRNSDVCAFMAKDIEKELKLVRN